MEERIFTEDIGTEDIGEWWPLGTRSVATDGRQGGATNAFVDPH